MPEELAPSEVAKRLGTSTRTVQRWIERWGAARTDALEDAGVSRLTRSTRPRPVSTRRRPAIRTLFIANRGEIARRIARTCDRLGIRAIVPETDGPNALDLLDADAVVAAARASGADAVHPGFGFLAENADFAERVEAAGLIWVGPPPDAIRAMGDKAAARRLAVSLGVPVLAGYDDADQDDDVLTKAARRIGFPVLVKPAAGGGGKGMRVVRDQAAFLDNVAASRREAQAAFGDERLILERFVEGARHVEVQVLFDAARERHPPRRARLLDPAAPPEDPRGEPVAGHRWRPAPAPRRRGARARARGRLRERRHLRVPRSTSAASRRSWR